MRIYLASRFTRMMEMREYREQLHDDGHVVTSRWLDEQPGEGDKYHPEAWPGIALVDVEDVRRADALVAFTELPRTWTRGGRHVEFGMGLGLGKYLFVIGPIENVFHALPGVGVYPDWESLRKELKTWPQEFGQTLPMTTPHPQKTWGETGRTEFRKRIESYLYPEAGSGTTQR